jgi:hypothetical protein
MTFGMKPLGMRPPLLPAALFTSSTMDAITVFFAEDDAAFNNSSVPAADAALLATPLLRCS